MKLVKRLSRARLGCHTLHSGTDGMKFKEKPERKQNFLTLILLVCSLSRKIIIKWVETGIQNQVSLNRKTALLKKKKKTTLLGSALCAQGRIRRRNAAQMGLNNSQPTDQTLE